MNIKKTLKPRNNQPFTIHHSPTVVTQPFEPTVRKVGLGRLVALPIGALRGHDGRLLPGLGVPPLRQASLHGAAGAWDR